MISWRRRPGRVLALGMVTASLAACSVFSPPLLSPVPVDATPFGPVIDGSSASVGRLLSTTCAGAPISGSGFVVGTRLVLTAAHVVDGARQVSLRFGARPPLGGQVVGIDLAGDTALVRTSEAVDAPVVELAGTAISPGSVVAVVGYPLGESTLRAQIARVTAVTDAVRVNGPAIPDLVTVDATIAAGSSGGPVLDADAAAQGMVSAQIGGRGGRDSAALVTVAVPAKALAEHLSAWRSALPAQVSCGGEKEAAAASGVQLTLATDAADAPELGQVIWLFEAGVASGQLPSAWGQLTPAQQTRAGGFAAWSAKVVDPRWSDVRLLSVSRDGDRARAVTRLRGATAAHACLEQDVGYDFALVNGTWLIDGLSARTAAAVC